MEDPFRTAVAAMTCAQHVLEMLLSLTPEATTFAENRTNTSIQNEKNGERQEGNAAATLKFTVYITLPKI
jgi:hypothetical protein